MGTDLTRQQQQQKKKKKTRDIGEEESVSMQGIQARTGGFKGVFKGGFRSEPCESLTVIPEERLLVKLQCPVQMSLLMLRENDVTRCDWLIRLFAVQSLGKVI